MKHHSNEHSLVGLSVVSIGVREHERVLVLDLAEQGQRVLVLFLCLHHNIQQHIAFAMVSNKILFGFFKATNQLVMKHFLLLRLNCSKSTIATARFVIDCKRWT